MKNVVMLSAILAVVSVPRYLYAAVPIFSRNYGCLVDNWTGGWQRFYYCGNQNFDCGAEKHNNNDYSVCNDGREVPRKDGFCYLTDGTKFTTRSGDTFYCCNGTSTTMGTIQKDPCEPPETPPEGGGSGSGTDGFGFWSGSGSDNEDRTGESEGSGGSNQPEPPQPPQQPPQPQQPEPPTGGTNNGSNGGQWGATNLDAFLGCDTSDIRNGFCPSTKGCVTCPSGKYFNEKDSANGCCSYAIGLTKTDMMYGYGKTQNSNPRLRNQCWTIKDIARYRACVLSGVQKTTTIKVPIQSAMDTAVANTVSEK